MNNIVSTFIIDAPNYHHCQFWLIKVCSLILNLAIRVLAEITLIHS